MLPIRLQLLTEYEIFLPTALKAPADKEGSTCDSAVDAMVKARELHLEILRLTSCFRNNKLLANEFKA